MAVKKKTAKPLSSFDDLDAAGIGVGYQPFVQESGEQDAAPSRVERTWGQAIGDTAVQLAEGVNTTLGAVPSIVAPDGAMAGFFRDNADYWRDKQSEVLKQRIAATDQRIQEAGKEGVLSQIGTAASEYWNDPAQAARLVATNLPSMAATLGTGALAGAAAKGVAAARGIGAAGEAALAAQYGTRTAMATNAALNAGGARGEAYEDLKRAALAQGMSAEQAEQVALDGSIMPGVVGGVAGAVSGKLGLEKALLGQPGAGAGTALRRAAGAFGAELAGEQIEEVAPKITTNYEAGKIDPARSLTDDLGRTMVETAIGAGPGAIVAGGVEGMSTPAKEAADTIRNTEKLPETGTLTKAVNAGVEAKAQAVEAGGLELAPLVDGAAPEAVTSNGLELVPRPGEQAPEPVDDPVRDQILALPDGARQDALRAYAVVNRTDVAKGVQQYNRKLLDRLLAENQPAPETAPEVGGIVRNFDPKSQPTNTLSLAPMGEAAYDNGIDFQANAQSELARRNAELDDLTRRAPRTSTAPVDLSLPTDPVQNYLDNLRSVNTPAARAYVRDFDAGRITPADVQRRMQAEQGLTPEQRLARAAAEAPAQTDPVADRLARAAAQGAAVPAPTDILNPAGEPFKTRMAADRAAKKTPGAVVPVEGGFVVRPQESVNVQDVPQAPEVPQAAPAVSQPAQAPQAVGAQPAGPAAGVSAEGAGAVEAAGVKPAGQRQLSADEQAAQDREEARAKELSLPPVLSARLQEAHKAHGRGVKRSVVERSIANEKANNTGTPKAKRERADRIARLEADLALFDEAAAMPPKEAAGVAPATTRIGRDQTPLSEGGKPFKTRKAAGDAKKLQPMMRVVTVPGGYALAEKTPAQLAAEERAAKRLRTARTSPAGEPVPAHAFIAASGGLHMRHRNDLGVDGNPRIGNRRLFGGLNRGLSIEQATEMLVADGYLSEGASHNDAYALIKKSLSQPQYNADGYERIAQAEADAQFEDYLAAQEEAAADGDTDPFGWADEFTAEELDEVGYTDADPALQAEVSALIAQAEAMDIDTYAILEDIARTYANATQDQYNTAAREAIAAAIARSNQDGGSAAAQAAPAAESAADQGLDQPPALELASQAPAEGPTDSASERFLVGRSLTKAQRQQVLASLVDTYKAKGAQREFKGLDGNGNERYGYIYSPELFEKSDITGAMVRYYVTLPDGRIAHPSELFPEVSASDVERMALEQDTKRNRLDAYENALKPFYSDFASANLMAGQGQVVIEKSGRFAIIPERTGAIGQARQNGWELASPSVRAADRFELGQDPMDSLTGQGSVFDAQEPEQQAPAATEAVAPQPDTPKLTPAEAKSLMAWEDLGQKDGVKTHALTFYESQADKDAKRGRMIVAKVSKGDRSATAWMVDGEDKTFGMLAQAKKRAEEVGMAKAVADGYVDKGVAMFSSADSTLPAKPLTLDRVNQLVQEALSGIRGAPPVEVTGRPADVGLRVPAGSVGYGVTLRSGDIYVFQSAMGSDLDVFKTVFHELFHRGVRVLVPKGQYVQTMLDLAKGDSRIQQLAIEWKNTEMGQKQKDNLRQQGYTGAELTGQYEALAIEEALAAVAEEIKAEGKLGSKPKNMTIRFLANWLAKVADLAGMKKLAQGIRTMTYNEAERFVMSAISRSGEPVQAGRTDNMSSKQAAQAADQTQTEAFKRWFAGSRVVDADGNPLVVYHGTNSDLSAFASDRANYFTADPGAASVYAEGFGAPREGANVSPVYLSIQRPKWMPLTDSAKLTAADLAAIKEEGFDGVFGWTLDTGMGGPTPIAREVGTGQRGMDKIVTEAIPLSPEQIKSAIGNRGTFDPANPDIRRSFAGQQAATADTMALATAQQRLDAGEDAETVRRDTGWFRGADGKWRFEINDADARLKDRTQWTAKIDGINAKRDAALQALWQAEEQRNDFLRARGESPSRISSETKKTPEFKALAKALKNAEAAAEKAQDAAFLARQGDSLITVGDVLSHPALFAAYPEIADVRVNINDSLPANNAAYAYELRAIELSGKSDAQQLLSTLLHEIQHGIQHIEGFAMGGTPQGVAPILEKERFEAMVNRDDALTAEFDALKLQYAGVPESEIPQEVVNRVRQLRGEINAIRNTGWREASNPFARRQPTPEELFAGYRRLAGEVEARNTQARQNLTDAQRRATPPSQTADVADSDVIVMFNGKVAMSAPTPANAAPDAAPQPPRTPAATIRAAINRAYGKLLGQLEAKGLVTLAQTEAQAIEAAAQARAKKTGGDVAQIKRSLTAAMQGGTANESAGNELLFARAPSLDKNIPAFGDIRKPRESLSDVANGLSNSTKVLGNRTVSMDSVVGMMSASVEDMARAKELASKLMQPDAFFERVILDDVGNVIEGQHRVVALRILGAKAVPAVVIKDYMRDFDEVGVNTAIRNAQKIGGDQVNQLTGMLAEIYADENGDIAEVELYDPPAGYEKAWQAGIDKLKEARTGLDIKRSANGAVQGFFDPQTGQSFLIADNLSAEAAPGVLMHEVGIHMAADGSMKALFNRAVLMLKAQKADPFMRAVQAKLDAAGETSPEEVSAYLVEAYENQRAQAPASVKRWLADLLATVKAWLYKKGIVGADSLTVADVAAVARANAKSFSRRESPSRAGGLDAITRQRGVDTGESLIFSRSRLSDLKASAIGNNGNFDPANPDIRFSRTTAQSIASSMGDMTPDQEKAYKNVAGVKAVPTVRERMDSLKANLGLKLRQALVDQFAAIKQLDQNAYVQARMSKGTDGTLEAMLMYGKPFMRDGAPDVDVKDGGFAKVLASLNGEQDRWMMWIAAQRAEKLKAEGKENLMTDDDISALKTLNAGKMADGTARMPIYAKALAELNEYNDAMLKLAMDSGLIDQAAYDLMAGQPYVPFYRLMEDGDMKGPKFSSGLTNQKAWQKLKGGTQQLNADLLQNMLLNWSHLLQASAKNRAAIATMDAAEKMAVAYKVDAGTKGAVKVMRDGSAEHWMVEDPYLLDAISAIHYVPSPLMKPLAKFKQLLTWGVTVNPTFKIRNLIRDSVSAIAQSELGYNPAGNVSKGWKLTAKDSQIYASMLASGGLIKFGTQENTDRLRAQVAKLGGVVLDKSGTKRFFGQIKDLYDVYNEFGDRAENVNRAALYDALIKKGKTHAEAAFMARDLMDFSMGGSAPVVRFLTQTVPFLNARLVGLDKLGRAAIEDPRRFAAVTGAVALASLALMAGYSDDEDWKKREDWDRDAYWWFKIGGHAYRIPKPFEVGAIGTLAERTAELMLSDEMTGKRYMERVSHMLSGTFSFNPVPQAFKPLLDLYANKDSFTGRAIESQADQRLRPQDRYSERTPEVAKFLGGLGLPDPAQLVNGEYSALSPKQVEHLIRGYFSWVGTAALTVSDFGLRPLAGRGERPDWRLKDVFVVGNFVENLPTGSSRYVTQMYEQARQVEQAYASYQEAIKSGDMEKAQAVKESAGPLLHNRAAYTAATRQLSAINSEAKRIEASQVMPGAAKRARLTELEHRRHVVAQRVSRLAPATP